MINKYDSHKYTVQRRKIQNFCHYKLIIVLIRKFGTLYYLKIQQIYFLSFLHLKNFSTPEIYKSYDKSVCYIITKRKVNKRLFAIVICVTNYLREENWKRLLAEWKIHTRYIIRARARGAANICPAQVHCALYILYAFVGVIFYFPHRIYIGNVRRVCVRWIFICSPRSLVPRKK